MFDSSPYPTFVVDLDTLRFLAANDTAVRHYGYSREELLRMTMLDIRPREEALRLAKAMGAVRASPHATTGFGRHRKKDGTIIDVEVAVHPLLFAGQRAVLALVHDITERKQVETELRDLTAQLISAQETERRRISRELHDNTNQKLAMLLVDLETLQAELCRATPALRERLQSFQARLTELSDEVRGGVLELAIQPSRKAASVGLTPRQREVVQLVAEGRSLKEIASLLSVSIKTVEYHKARSMQQLGIRTTADLIKYAVTHGLVVS